MTCQVEEMEVDHLGVSHQQEDACQVEEMEEMEEMEEEVVVALDLPVDEEWMAAHTVQVVAWGPAASLVGAHLACTAASLLGQAHML